MTGSSNGIIPAEGQGNFVLVAGHMKLVEQDGVTALLLSEPERAILRKALKSVKPKVLEPAESVIVDVAVKLLTRMGPAWR